MEKGSGWHARVAAASAPAETENRIANDNLLSGNTSEPGTLVKGVGREALREECGDNAPCCLSHAWINKNTNTAQAHGKPKGHQP